MSGFILIHEVCQSSYENLDLTCEVVLSLLSLLVTVVYPAITKLSRQWLALVD